MLAPEAGDGLRITDDQGNLWGLCLMPVSQAVGAAVRPIAGKPGFHRDRVRADRCLPQGMAAPVRASAARAAQSRA
ncbi:hypothetical protein EGJ22_16870, partial [Pseudomonas sp. p99-361]